MPKSFFIIDGHAHIYRAYFAPFRDLTSASGEPTKATFVFTQMLMNLIELRKPDYLAMVIDTGDEDVFRKTVYPEYKANRVSPPDDFRPQEQRILQIVADAGVPIFKKSGFEADDLIATMAQQLCKQDYQVYLVSKDKDLRQVLDDCTFMYDPQNDSVFDVPAMVEKLGYTPAEAIDVQTLMGDAIDNVPGVPGVGEKTAFKLLKQYGSVQGILDNVEKLTPKMRDNFKAFGDKLSISRELVTLKKDVAFDWSPEQCKFKGLNVAGLKKHLVELDFRALLSRLSTIERSGKPVPVMQGGLFDTTHVGAPSTLDSEYQTSANTHYHLVNTPEALADFVKQLGQQKVFAFDTETDALRVNDANLVGMSFSWQEGTGWYVPVRGPSDQPVMDPQQTLVALKAIMEDPAIGKIGHNLKYDIQAMRHAGIKVVGAQMDTMVAAFLLDASRIQYGIDRLAADLLHFKKIPTSDMIGSGKNQITMDRISLDRITKYAGEDADIAWRLYELLSKKLDAVPALRKLHDEIETPLIDVLVEMEQNGISIDSKVLAEQSAALGERIEALRKEIHNLVGEPFNIDSPKQLAEILFTRLQLKSVKKTKTGHSTDIEVLEKLAGDHPVPKLVLEYRSLVKLKGTYLDALDEYRSPRDGRVHTSFNQTGAATGRLSSSDPNLQNIPIRTDEGRRIRLAFVPGDATKDVLLTADYSQIELRVLAHLSEEPALTEAFRRGDDVHTTVAAEVFNVDPKDVSREQRAQAKIVNFGIVYGVTAQGLARRIDGLSYHGAADLIAAYNKKFARIAGFMDECIDKARRDGYVETITGRRRPVFDISSGVVNQRNAAERIAINSVVQGSAADLIKIAMLNIYRKIKTDKLPLKLLLQVHDELVFEAPLDRAEELADFVKKEMTSAMSLKVPLDVEAGWGKNWQEVK